ncbi:MAG: YbhB/YbcL family Raf kinase inhibitor-like protein [Acidimicrobiia bacterium]
MKLTSSSFPDGGFIPDRYALAKPDPAGGATFSDNVNPQFSWDDVPVAAHSLALICHDPCCPSRPDDVNVSDREVPLDLERVDFFHWVLVDLPVSASEIDEGEFADGVVPHGKGPGRAAHGSRQGLNDYTGWFQGDPEMEGKFFGYDGPAPPWNDAMVHEYVFTLYALDLYRVPVDGGFTGPDVLDSIEGHVIDTAIWRGRYSQNTRLRD